MFHSVNPANGKLIATHPSHTREDINSIINKSQTAWIQWRQIPFKRRAELMQNLSRIILEEKESHAHLIVQEMGKPFKQAIAELEKCASVCRYYAENGESFLSNESIDTEATSSYIAYNPLGLVLAVMPWNFPFWQVFRFAAPALMAGNVCLLKHASNVMGTAMAIEDVIKRAGFPENVFRTLRIKSSEVAGVIENPLVKAVTLTGSVGAGKAVAQKAGEQLKKTVLELGGSDPYIILDDADLELAAEACVTSRLLNNGQSCIAAKRFIVVEEIYDAFEKLFVEKMGAKKTGDPFDAKTDVGPMAQEKLRDELHEQVRQSIELGAICILGGFIPLEKGAWYPPTILTNIKPGMPAYEEELFGPVAAIIRARDQEDAIRIANDSVFGLGAAVFTADLEKGQYIAENLLNAGCCFVNDFVKSDPRLPFGGIGQSGYGRELSYLGIREFVNIKTVFVK